MKEFEYFSPTKIVFGEGKLQEIANFLPSVNRILVVTGRHSSKANGSLDLLKTSLKEKTLLIFDEVEENPGLKTINKGANIARREKIEIVIGLGGGSPMDAAKCIALLQTNDRLMEDYLIGAINELPLHSPLPIIEIPTTAGTGSETTQHAVITMDSHKKGYSNQGFFPKIAILDPILTLSMPREVTVNTGIDALTHSIEGHLSTLATAKSDNVAVEAIGIIKEKLPKVAQDGENLEARSQMLYASMLGGLVISRTRTIILHALGYPLTTFYGMPHGRANGALLPWALEFLSRGEHTNSPLQEKISSITEIFGDINKFINNLGISTKLSDYGITENDIPGFVGDVWGRRNLEVTPKEVKQEDIANIYRQAL